MYNFKGSIQKIGKTEIISDKFSKREMVVLDASSPQFPNPIPMQLTNDRCKKLDGFAVGDEVSIEFFLRGNTVGAQEGKDGKPATEEKTFCNIEAYSIKKAE